MRRLSLIRLVCAACLLLAASCALGTPARAQDEPVPKPKPKPAAPATKATKAQPSGPSLLILCDLACDWKVDGGLSKGRIEAASSAKVHVELGQHQVAVYTTDGQDGLQQVVDIQQSGQRLISFDLGQARTTRLQKEQQSLDQAKLAERERAERAQMTWRDPVTGLEWTKDDNGSDVNWNDANNYCGNLRLSGHSDWRLATIDELQRMYDPQSNVNGYRVKGNLQLSGWEWSSSKGDGSGVAWIFYFYDGERHSFPLGHSGFIRALCVRRSGE